MTADHVDYCQPRADPQPWDEPHPILTVGAAVAQSWKQRLIGGLPAGRIPDDADVAHRPTG